MVCHVGDKLFFGSPYNDYLGMLELVHAEGFSLDVQGTVKVLPPRDGPASSQGDKDSSGDKKEASTDEKKEASKDKKASTDKKKEGDRKEEL